MANTTTLQIRATPEILKVLAKLQKKTALDRTSVVKLAIMEMAERRLNEKEHASKP